MGIPINAPIPVKETIVPIIMFIKPIAFLEGFQKSGNTKNPKNPKNPITISFESSEEDE